MPFSIPFYRWLLTEENSLSLADLGQVAPEVQGTLLRLNEMVKQRDIIQSDTTIDAMEKTEKVSSIKFSFSASTFINKLFHLFHFKDRNFGFGWLSDFRFRTGLCVAGLSQY